MLTRKAEKLSNSLKTLNVPETLKGLLNASQEPLNAIRAYADPTSTKRCLRLFLPEPQPMLSRNHLIGLPGLKGCPR